jgi:hypothetical protein
MTDTPRVDWDELELSNDLLILWKGQPFTGFAVEFYPDGRLASEVMHVDGMKHGLSRSWYDSGQLMDEETYWLDGLHGYCREWAEQGRLVSEVLGELGIQIAEKRWDDQGRLIKDWHIGPNDNSWTMLQFNRKHLGHRAPPLPKT